MPDVQYAAAPALAHLAGLRIWCNWMYAADAEGEKPRKIPYSGCWSRAARSNDPSTWVTLAEARMAAAQLLPGMVGGVGVFLGPLPDGTGWLMGIDYDACVGPEGLEAWALGGLGACSTYCEISPSGVGLKQFALLEDEAAVRRVFGLTPAGDGSHSKSFKLPDRVDHKPGFEICLSSRFFSVTGDDLYGDARGLARFGAAEAERLMADGVTRLMGSRPSVTPLPASRTEERAGAAAYDGALAERLSAAAALRPKLKRLLDGNTSDLEDNSRSVVAFNVSRELFDAGWSEADREAVLRGHPVTAEWTADKGDAAGGRELRRALARPEGTVAEIGALPAEPGMSSADPPPWKRSATAVAGDTVPRTSVPGHGTLSWREDGHPVVTVRAPVHEMVDDAETAISCSGLPIFQRGGELVRPALLPAKATGDRDTATAALMPLTVPGAVDALSQAAAWRAWDGRKKDYKWTSPPEQAARVWLSRAGRWRARPVFGVATVPTLRRDGSLLHEPGYDERTRIYLLPDSDVRLPDGWIGRTPTKADAEEALALLDALLDEFPFEEDMDRAVALSAMLTVAARGAMDVCPMHAFDAPQASSGKSYLVDLACAAVLGRPAPVATAGKTQEETEKRLGATMLSGAPVGVIDNVNGRLESDLLCQAIERPVVKIRVLGLSKEAQIENSICLFATGNNLEIVGDLVRRTLKCRLAANVERPEMRAFRGRPRDAVLADRGRYVAAALTVVRAHMLAGCPGAETMRPLASFEDWSRTVRGALRWLGRPDPVDTMERTYQEDPDRKDLAAVLKAWAAALGTGREYLVREIVEATVNPVAALSAIGGDAEAVVDRREAAGTLRDAVLKVSAGRNGAVDPVRLGRWLGRHKGQIMAGYRFVEGTGNSHGKIKGWTVERIAPHLRVVG